VVVAGPGRGEEPAELTTVRAVAEAHLLPDAPPPVRLDVVVTGRHPSGSILVRDATGATFVRRSADGIAVAPGDRLRVRGSVYAGVFIDGVTAATVENLGPGPAPEPVPVTPSDLAAGLFFHDLVTAVGIVRSVTPGVGASGQTLRLNVPGGAIEARLDAPVAADEVARLIAAEVRITGFGSGETGPDRHMLRPFVRLPDAAGMRIVTPAPPDPFAGPTVPLDRLGRLCGSAGRVKVAGVAAARGGTGGGLFLAADGRGLFVQPALADDALRRIAPGDRVEAAGFVTASAASPVLGDAVVRVTGTGAIPASSPLIGSWTDSQGDWFQRLRAELWRDAVPVEFHMAVTERTDRPDGTELLGRTIVRGMSVRCMVPARAAGGAVPGSELRVRGVYRITRTDGDPGSVPVAIDVWPGAAADLVVVRAAPWWTRPEVVNWLAAGLAVAAVAVGGAAAWVVFLRREVRRQLGIVEEKAQREAMLEERQRIAREFHDSLEQDLAAMALRLDAVCETAPAEAMAEIDQQRAAVLRLQDESRNFVWDLRDAAAADRPLDESLARLVEELRHCSPAPIRLRVEGGLGNPPLAARQQLLRIVREAVANAVSHAHASKIDVVAAARSGGVAVEVRDDGEGFDLDACERKAGHFGIRGMRERARRSAARLEIASRPRSGTTVRVSLGGE
jgi:signal transduction histidine kinase